VVSARVTIKGIDRLTADLKGGLGIPRGVERGINLASAVVEEAAKNKVHILSGKLKSSLGYTIRGSGMDTTGVIGPQPGFGQPRGYTYKGKKVWNRGDPAKGKKGKPGYGLWEEVGNRWRSGHPFLVPALLNNADRIRGIINDAVEAELSKGGR